jgi:hypothetical protein
VFVLNGRIATQPAGSSLKQQTNNRPDGEVYFTRHLRQLFREVLEGEIDLDFVGIFPK